MPTQAAVLPTSALPAQARAFPAVAAWLRHHSPSLILPVALLAAWQAVCSAGLVQSLLLPSPLRIGETLWALAQSGDLVRHVGASLSRVLQGFAIASVAALVLGVAMGMFRPVSRLANLLIQILKPIPPIAWIPLAILWFGIGEEAKIFIIVIGAFFPVLINTVDALRQVDQRHVELARVLEVPKRHFIREILIPSALPQIMSGLRLGVTLSWMCVVAAELIAASRGVGYLIMDGRSLSQADIVLAGMITMGVLGKVTDDVLCWIERRLIRWRTAFTGL